MIAETRHQMILDILHKQRSASVQELAEQLHISESTIRRDLIVLDRQGKLTKVYGGAMAMNMESSYDSYEPDMDTKEGLYVEEKKRMGQYAASLIRADDFVYIDAGTSTIHLVNAIDGDAKKSGVRHKRPAAHAHFGAKRMHRLCSGGTRQTAYRSHRGRCRSQQSAPL